MERGIVRFAASDLSVAVRRILFADGQHLISRLLDQVNCDMAELAGEVLVQEEDVHAGPREMGVNF